MLLINAASEKMLLSLLDKQYIYIYGAGMVGRLVAKRIKKSLNRPCSILYAVRDTVQSSVDGIPVIKLCNLKNMENQIVIIATLSNLHQEIAQDLEQAGFSKIILISESLFQEMRFMEVDRRLVEASLSVRLSEMIKMDICAGRKKLLILNSAFIKGFNYSLYDRYWEIKTVDEFMENDIEVNTYDSVSCPLLPWDKNWPLFLKKLLTASEQVILSFRRGYIQYRDFSLLDLINGYGFIITNQRTFYRDSRECDTDELIFKLEKAHSFNISMDRLCNGCGACVVNCPSHALQLRKDADGNYKPFLKDSQSCMQCNRCVEACPAKHAGIEKKNFKVYRFKNKQVNMINALIQSFKEGGGSVFHAVLDEKYQFNHLLDDVTGLFLKVKEVLSQGGKVLFLGTPCQVSGLYCYITGTGEGVNNLYTADVICNQGQNSSLYQYKSEILENSTRNAYSEAFYNGLMVSEFCENCRFMCEGDLTISENIICNNKLGKELAEYICGFLDPVQDEVTEIKKTRMIAHHGRDRFRNLVKEMQFSRAVEYSLYNKYDIGLVGNWSWPNYGAELTYFALYKTLRDMGYSVLMIEWPEDSYKKPYGYAQLFFCQPYANTEISMPSETAADMVGYNKQCKTFIHGSDQNLNPLLMSYYNKNVLLKWVAPDKNKIAYALSFGFKDTTYQDNDRFEAAFYLNQYNSISSREDSGVETLANYLNVPAQQVLDPVFLCEKEEYLKFVQNSALVTPSGRFLFSYVLDYDKYKGKAVSYISNRRDACSIVVTDADKYSDPSFSEEDGTEVFSRVSVETWLDCIINCDFCLTDSFHAVCFCILFEKDFIAVANGGRGITRFESMLRMLGLESRLVYNMEDIYKREDLFSPVDYSEVNIVLTREKQSSIEWLMNALKEPVAGTCSPEYRVLKERCDYLEKELSDLKLYLKKLI